nr:hypothetical protein [Tanacetum cinerariifolium]
MTEPSWIDAMQKEIHEFERREVWELVSGLHNVFFIKLKWIYKIKTDESGGVLKNKAQLVTQGFRQKEEHNFFQDFLNTSESSNDDSNVVIAPQEPIVFNQEPGENSSQSPPHIDHHCCFGYGDSLDGIFCQRCTCKSCGKGANYGYNYPPKVPIISNPEPCHNQNVEEFSQTLPSFHPTCYSRDENSFAYDPTPDFVNDSSNIFNPPSQHPSYSYEFCGNDAQYGHDCPPQVLYNPKPGPHETFRCKLMNYYEPNPCYDSNSFGFDNFQPSQPVIDHLNLQQRINDSMIELHGTFQASEDESISDEDILKEIYSNPLFDEEIISIKIEPHHFSDESDLIESMLNQDSSIISSSKIDSLLDEFAGELIFIKSIPLGIYEADCDPEEEICLIDKLLYDNSSPRPPEAINSENSDAVIESFSPSPIPFKDSDPFMEEINLFLTSNGPIPPGIDSDYSNSERENLVPERLLHDDLIPLPDILDFSNVVRIFPPLFTYPVTSLILISSGNEDIIFDPGISNYHLSYLEPDVSHQSGTFMKFNVYPNHLNESLMEILSSTFFPIDQ